MYFLNQVDALSRVTLSTPLSLPDREILTPEAIEFVSVFSLKFEDRRRKLLARRAVVQHEINLGLYPGFPRSTADIRTGVWRVRPVPAGSGGYRADVSVPASDRILLSMVSLSGSDVCIADFGDLQSPGWMNILDGQRNLKGLFNGTGFSAGTGPTRHPQQSTAISLRPRGWHLTEGHFHLNGEPVSATLFDLALFLYHNGRLLIEGGSAPSVHLPKIENRFEAALWNEVCIFAEEYLGLPENSLRTTVAIETFPAAFEIDEILFELRDRTNTLVFNGKNYLFSVLQKLHNFGRFAPAERNPRNERPAFLDACLALMIQKAHQRGVQALAVPLWEPDFSGDGSAGNTLLEPFLEQVTTDLSMGVDGIVFNQPALARMARESILPPAKSSLKFPVAHEDIFVSETDLMDIERGTVTESGVRSNIRTAVLSIETWLDGRGTISHDGVLADISDTELSRAELWHWLHHALRLKDGNILDARLFRKYFTEEVENIRQETKPERFRREQFDLASRILFNVVHRQDFHQFLTTKINQYL